MLKNFPLLLADPSNFAHGLNFTPKIFPGSKSLFSTKVVNKLKLKCTTHSKEIMVSWLQNGNKVTIMKNKYCNGDYGN